MHKYKLKLNCRNNILIVQINENWKIISEIIGTLYILIYIYYLKSVIFGMDSEYGHFLIIICSLYVVVMFSWLAVGGRGSKKTRKRAISRSQ